MSSKGNLSPILLTSAQRRFSSWMQISIETTTTCADHPRLDKEKFRPILETCFLKKMEIANESKSRQTLSLHFSVGLIGDFFSLQLYLTLFGKRFRSSFHIQRSQFKWLFWIMIIIILKDIMKYFG